VLRRVCSRGIVWLLLVVGLVACTSPQERSVALTTEILQGLPLPDGATLLYSNEFERLAKTGIGTHFGVRGLYGCNADYAWVVEQHRELLRSTGWIEYAPIDTDNPLFCNFDHEGVRLSLVRLGDLEDGTLSITDSLLSEYEATHRTLYVVTVVHFPFDDIGCGQTP